MRPVRISWASVPIPFRTPFAHASATRRTAENLIVRVEDADGRVGLGEGCPRAYVTGETVASATGAVARWSRDLMRLEDLESLRAWLIDRHAEIDAAPSAGCAAELALLDLFARQADQPVEDLLGVAQRCEPLAVTAVYGDKAAAIFLLQEARFRAAGMTVAKMKLSGSPSRNAWRAKRLARAGPLQLDANNLWPDAETALKGLSALRSLAWAVEEPVQPRDWPGIATVGRESGLAIILDESFGAVEDFDRLEPGPRYLVNLRLSHGGGLIRTLAAIQAAEQRSVEVILGSHVGETSILARAGLVAAAAARSLAGYEGAYGTRLLKHDLVTPSLRFGDDGKLMPARDWRRDAPGWGVVLTRSPQRTTDGRATTTGHDDVDG